MLKMDLQGHLLINREDCVTCLSFPHLRLHLDRLFDRVCQKVLKRMCLLLASWAIKWHKLRSTGSCFLDVLNDFLYIDNGRRTVTGLWHLFYLLFSRSVLVHINHTRLKHLRFDCLGLMRTCKVLLLPRFERCFHFFDFLRIFDGS